MQGTAFPTPEPARAPAHVVRWLGKQVRGQSFRDGATFVRTAFSLMYQFRGTVMAADEAAQFRAAARAVWHTGQPRPAGLPGRVF